ncbi:MFS transporter [Streptomyces chumphonensis]|uniref:MFS transporter n=1 Tax=Streptomyces chumphonensis TaxID=1214925 RepID=A0A927F0S4_9ACTN|nr:MFS transporter [Streptomyces chumphonensis]MBD3933504.1 MFS transporter [Streptomyces chumphonensis]
MVQVPAASRISTARRRTPPLWAVLFAACAGQFLVVLDIAVVNVALPSMRDDLGMSAAGLQWVVNAYTITFAGLLLFGGRAGDLFGRKRLFLIGLAVFTLASLAGGLAQESWHLLAARAVQGVGAAALAPSTLTLLTVSVPEGPARARAIGTWTAVGAGGGAAGGLVGGVLTEGLSWRWVLLVNVPIGAVVLLAAAWWLVETRTGGRRRLDVPGAVLVTAGLATLAYGIVETESTGWGAPSALVPLLGGLALLGAFLAVEARAPVPLMPLRLFRLPAVAAANTAMFVMGATMVCSWYFITLYLQNVLLYSPIAAGLSCVPHSLVIVAASKVAPRLMVWAGPRNVAVAGCVMAAAGYLWQSTLHADGTYLGTVLGPGLLMMAGAGLTATPLASAATTGAPTEDAGIASGLVNMARTMGGSLGLAVLSTVAAARMSGPGPEGLAPGYALAFQLGAAVLAVNALFILLALPRAPRPARKDR